MSNNRGILVTGLILLALAGGGVAIWQYSKNKNANKGTSDVTPEDLNAIINGGQLSSTTTSAPAHTLQQIYNSLPLGSFQLKKGSKNKLVFILQAYLNCRYKSKLTVDGDFGTGTEKEVQKIFGVSILTSQVHLANLIKAKGYNGVCETVAHAQFVNALQSNNFMNYLQVV